MSIESIEQLRAELKRLQGEAIAAHSRAAGGDKQASVRRGELMTAVQFQQALIADAEIAQQATQADKQVDRAKSQAAASLALTANVRGILAGRDELAATAHDLAVKLGETLNQLSALHLEAGSQVRRSMVVDHALGLDTDDAGCIRAVLSTLFAIAKVDTADAMRSMETLNFGLQWSPEDVRDTVTNQNSLLMAIRESSDTRWADHLADLEAQQEVANV
jgi:hypothetical protein